MSDYKWYISRLEAMPPAEIFYRLYQEIYKQCEMLRYKKKEAVTAKIYKKSLAKLALDPAKMHLNMICSKELREASSLAKNEGFDEDKYSIDLLGDYDYQKYKKQWHAGFQTEKCWPLEASYSLKYKQRDDIGDARTNWELNRHYQFAYLAKEYALGGNKKILEEFKSLFYDWNNNNPFLYGISWTDAMEIAIRLSNWCYCYCFLSGLDDTKEICDSLRIGIINMADYVSRHLSCYSSANNHLIVEAYAVGQTGILTGHAPWIRLACNIIDKQFEIQNYSDGVNKEGSLHYHSFYLEAVGLFTRLLEKNGEKIDSKWYEWIGKMSDYLRDCMGAYCEVIEFSDNDEGKLLDLSSKESCYYRYVLQLVSSLLQLRYDKCTDYSENIRWLFSKDGLSANDHKQSYKTQQSKTYTEGGITIFRSPDEKVLIGINHAPLGFAPLAAHAHADALSFQLFVLGWAVFVDPGTYIYHIDRQSRDDFRRTINHNTICVDGKNQSEILGPFLWGRKAETKLTEYSAMGENSFIIKATNYGYKKPVTRQFEWTKDELRISDYSENENTTVTFNIGPGCNIAKAEVDSNCSIAKAEVDSNCSIAKAEDVSKYIISGSFGKIDICFEGNGEVIIRNIDYSSHYGEKQKIKSLLVPIKGTRLITTINCRE